MAELEAVKSENNIQRSNAESKFSSERARAEKNRASNLEQPNVQIEEARRKRDNARSDFMAKFGDVEIDIQIAFKTWKKLKELSIV
ncbi:hypothetical protein M501DRAFT_1019957 [Patellaria atrata CBS 101060]|uniref:Uncharacterized protein n=1 Tax=Patellaria atrata CBS 101060 TaxID=1346257 RepID=A0A9P4VMQ5_9PEZI|nr:hypothetical protein M501DRAFT_1019957 [Patellaria atrata CBS 101060]